MKVKPLHDKLDYESIPAFDKSGLVNVVIETPRGSRNKYCYNPEYHLFELSNVMPVGSSFPYDFGFVPHTLAEDGDPVDVLVLMDEPAYPGTLVKCRVIGALVAEEQTPNGPERNDRLVAVYKKCLLHQNTNDLNELNATLLNELERFFEAYKETRGKDFKIVARCGPLQANALVKEGEKRYAAKKEAEKKSGDVQKKETV
jgi:inorganic pyrophosphatase